MLLKKIQRKLLTGSQRDEICEKQKDCYKCPLNFRGYCKNEIYLLSNAIENYWNEEIEVDI